MPELNAVFRAQAIKVRISFATIVQQGPLPIQIVKSRQVQAAGVVPEWLAVGGQKYRGPGKRGRDEGRSGNTR